MIHVELLLVSLGLLKKIKTTNKQKYPDAVLHLDIYKGDLTVGLWIHPSWQTPCLTCMTL